MRDKYLYFGLNVAGTEAFDNHAAQTLQLTTGFVNPIPVGVNYLANGGAKVTVTYNAEHTYGTAYAGMTGEIDITKGCTIHVTSALITIATAAADPVYGWTKSGTANNNDLDVTQLKPYDTGDCFVYNSRYLRGMHYQTTTTTELHFQGKTGDVGALDDVDTITVTHGATKHKEFIGGLSDILADDKAVSGMVVVADNMRGIFTPHDQAAIASVAQTATAS
tara:strand:+ start:814 stop:1476 length:663 start_codon:yes stop_codon:yes gene_type:complete